MIVDRRLMKNARENKLLFQESLWIARKQTAIDREYVKELISPHINLPTALFLSGLAIMPLGFLAGIIFAKDEYAFISVLETSILVGGGTSLFGGFIGEKGVYSERRMENSYENLRSRVIRQEGYDKFHPDGQMRFWFGSSRCFET